MRRNKMMCLFIDDYCANKSKKETCTNCSILKQFHKNYLKRNKK